MMRLGKNDLVWAGTAGNPKRIPDHVAQTPLSRIAAGIENRVHCSN